MCSTALPAFSTTDGYILYRMPSNLLSVRDINLNACILVTVTEITKSTRGRFVLCTSNSSDAVHTVNSFTTKPLAQSQLDNCNCHGQLPGFTIIDVRFRKITNVSVSRDL